MPLFGFGIQASKHQKLADEWDPKQENDSITMQSTYIGSTPVHKPGGDTTMDYEIKTILPLEKFNTKQRREVDLIITSREITIQNPKTKDNEIEIPINQISYCCADQKQIRLVATNDNRTFECHVFQAKKSVHARDTAKAIKKAFSAAYERLQQAMQNEAENLNELDTTDPEISETEKSDVRLIVF